MSKKRNKDSFLFLDLLKTIDLEQLIHVHAINIPLFYGTKNQYLKLQDYEYKGMNNISIKSIKPTQNKDGLIFKITLQLIVNFTQDNQFSSINILTKDGDSK